MDVLLGEAGRPQISHGVIHTRKGSQEVTSVLNMAGTELSSSHNEQKSVLACAWGSEQHCNWRAANGSVRRSLVGLHVENCYVIKAARNSSAATRVPTSRKIQHAKLTVPRLHKQEASARLLMMP